MKVTLIMATLGQRPEEITRFLEALLRGTHRDIELIVVDQTGDDRLPSLLSRYSGSLCIVHLRSEPGLSRARNVGLTHSTGEIVSFPDDDCWYPETVLASVAERFERDSSLDALAGHPIDVDGHSAFPRWERRSGWINRYNVWRRSNSNALFVRRHIATQVGGFDETLGLGSGTPWGSAEDVEFPLRLLEAGYPVYYDAMLYVYHAVSQPTYEPENIARAESYAGGMGRVLRQNRFPWWFVAYHLMRPTGGMILSLATGRMHKAAHHYAILRGRFQGWMSQ
jgi:glycosyltransferase involved in cell wall biosynthesis